MRDEQTATARTTILASAVLLVFCYWGAIAGMVRQWLSDADMGHGFLVPLVIGLIVWRERKCWKAVPASPDSWGLPILAAGLLLHAAGVLGGGLFASSLALLISVIGLIVFFAGFQRLRAWMFPLMLSLFMLPKLAVVYNQATLPMQLGASRIAASMLTISGVGVIRAGNILDVGGRQIAVAEACNGIRYLLSLGFLGVVVAYFADSRPWMRFALLISAVPIAVIANALRVALSAAIPTFQAEGPHAVMGLVLFFICFATLGLMQQFLSRVAGRSHA